MGLSLDELEQRTLAAFVVPPADLRAPVNDGTWTTPVADMYRSIGLDAEAREELRRALGPPCSR